MNVKSLKQKALAVAIIGAFAQPALANGECNAGDGLNSWSAWCGIDTYLSQQEPTAAGPIQGAGFSGLSNRSLNTNEFGGALNDNESNTAEFISYQLFNNTLLETTVVLNDTKKVATLTTSRDNVKNFESDSNLYNPQQGILFAGRINQNQTAIASKSSRDEWISIFPSKQQTNETPNIQNLTFGHVINISGNGPFHTGVQRTTDLVDMNNLKAKQASTNFTVQSTGIDIRSNGQSVKRSGQHAMFVDFGKGEWSMNNFYATNTAGTITGNKFQATSIVATNDKVISGDSFVKGAFTGANATNMTGMANIVKLKANNQFHKNIKVKLDGSSTIAR